MRHKGKQASSHTQEFDYYGTLAAMPEQDDALKMGSTWARAGAVRLKEVNKYSIKTLAPDKKGAPTRLSLCSAEHAPLPASFCSQSRAPLQHHRRQWVSLRCPAGLSSVLQQHLRRLLPPRIVHTRLQLLDHPATAVKHVLAKPNTTATCAMPAMRSKAEMSKTVCAKHYWSLVNYFCP